MPSFNLHILEPHPSVRTSQTHYLPSGRGGAGNMHSYHSSSLSSGHNASGPAFAFPFSRSKPLPPTSLTSSPSTMLHRASTSSTTSSTVDADSERARTQAGPLDSSNPAYTTVQPARVRMTGRGGAGNARHPASYPHAPYDLEAELRAAEQREVRNGSLALAPTRSRASAWSVGGRQSSVVHVGRGGAGNAVAADMEAGEMEMEMQERMRRAGSVASVGSARSGGSSVGSESGVGRFGRGLSRFLTRD